MLCYAMLQCTVHGCALHVTLCYALRATRYSFVLRAALCCAVLCCVVLCCAVLCCAVQHAYDMLCSVYVAGTYGGLVCSARNMPG